MPPSRKRPHAAPNRELMQALDLLMRHPAPPKAPPTGKRSVTAKRAKADTAQLAELLDEAVTMLRCVLQSSDRPAAWDGSDIHEIVRAWLTRVARLEHGPPRAREWLKTQETHALPPFRV